jgi:hypothetical protein
MSAIKLSTPSSGSISLSPADTASNLTITVPANSGTMITTGSTFAGTGPAFSAYLGSNQTVTQSTWTKLNINTEEFDTDSNYNTTNYRFTPTVAGYYQVNTLLTVQNTDQTYNVAGVFKNGSEFKASSTSAEAGSYRVSFSCLVYLNGTTDYIELYGQTTGGAPTFGSGANGTSFSAVLVRAA